MMKGSRISLSLPKSVHCLPRSALRRMHEVMETKLVGQSHMFMIPVAKDLSDRKRKLGQIIHTLDQIERELMALKAPTRGDKEEKVKRVPRKLQLLW